MMEFMRELFRSKLLWIAAFGYFVDLYDLVLYGVVRIDSLKTWATPASDLFSIGGRTPQFSNGRYARGWIFCGNPRRSSRPS